MPVPPPRPLTPLELDVMNALWELGPAPLQAVHARLAAQRAGARAGQRPLAYTTVQTMLNVLHRKGKVLRARRGRAFVYRAKESRRAASMQALATMLRRFFGGSAEGLVLSMVEAGQLEPEALERLRRLAESLAEKGAEP